MDPIYLIIGTDPTAWYLAHTDFDQVAAQLSQPGPVVLNVTSPLAGRLVLSAAGAGSVSLLNPPHVGGTHPTDIDHPAKPLLYVPTVTGPTRGSPGYDLAAGTDLGALEQAIVAAMGDGSSLAVQVSVGMSSGLMVLSGATLAFAVLCSHAPKD